MKHLIFFVIVLTVFGSGVASAESGAESCDDVRSLRLAGEFSRAIELAEECLEQHPENVETKIELGRLLAVEGRSDEATDWISRALEVNPSDPEALLLMGRLDARRGDFEAAGARLDELDDQDRQRIDVRRFEADLALWRGDFDDAVDRYDRYLEEEPDDGSAWMNRGHALAQAGRTSEAESSYRTSCEEGHREACSVVAELKEQGATRYFARFAPSYSFVADRPDAQRLHVVVGAEPTPRTGLEVGYLAARRGFGDGTVQSDLAMTAAGRWASENGPRFGAGGGWTFDPDFSPRWNAFVEGGWVADAGLDSGLRLWRLQFPTGGATVVNPSLTYYTGPWMFDGRYYLGIDDGGELDHSVQARAAYFFGDRTSVYAGAGAGNRPDYLEVTPLTEVPAVSHYTGLVGGALGLGDHHQLNLDLRYRHEGGFGSAQPPASDRYRAFEVGLTYTGRIW